jgi:hypothetical protein
MFTIDKFKIHRVSRVLVVACVLFTISASFAAAYVATAKPEAGAQTEQTSIQVDRTKKGDPLAFPLGKSRRSEMERNRSKLRSIRRRERANSSCLSASSANR